MSRPSHDILVLVDGVMKSSAKLSRNFSNQLALIFYLFIFSNSHSMHEVSMLHVDE